ncbi:MAG: hypothetical protein ACRD2A_19140 [Vicinamibacterales bacterium]
MTLDDRVAAILADGGVPHALIGAAALAAAGVARSTLDVDFLTTDARVLEPSFWNALRSAGAHVDIRRGDADDPLAGVMRASMPDERPVDLIVGRYEWQRRAIDRARALPTGLRVVQPRDVVLLKLYAGGTQDVWDIQQLLDAVDHVALISQVDEDVRDLPPQAFSLWAGIRGPQ